MSSHHIVRDAQEPALLLLDTNGCSFVLIQELLEWSPVVVVTDKVAGEVQQWGIKIDVVVCKDGQREEMQQLLDTQIPLEVVSYTTDPLAAVFAYLVNKQHKTVNIIAPSLQQADLLDTQVPLEVIVFHPPYKTFFVEEDVWEKWLPKDASLKTIPVDLVGENLVFHPTNQSWRVLQDGFVKIRSRKKGFWVSEEV